MNNIESTQSFKTLFSGTFYVIMGLLCLVLFGALAYGTLSEAMDWKVIGISCFFISISLYLLILGLYQTIQYNGEVFRVRRWKTTTNYRFEDITSVSSSWAGIELQFNDGKNISIPWSDGNAHSSQPSKKMNVVVQDIVSRVSREKIKSDALLRVLGKNSSNEVD